ncbi:MAG: hypothetical protein ABR508_03075 [Candidatus Baltobacteraceae bacterium]
MLPGHRIVAYYGADATPSMGVLGSGPIQAVVRKLHAQAAAYEPFHEPVIPALELITVTAQRDPGAYGSYSMGESDSTVERYLHAARAMHGMLILDIQPGRAAFLPLVKKYERFLREPDVGLALDSEWSMGASEVPGEVIGGTDAATVNAVAAYLSAIVQKNRLGQKLLIVHQFTPDMIAQRSSIRAWPGLALVFHVDGFGDRANKLSKYAMLARNRGAAFLGIKLFYDQDIAMFSAREIMRLQPPPDLITYQ